LTKPVPTAYGMALVFLRNKFRWAKQRLANATGKSVAQLTRYEKGDQELFRPMLQEILAALPLEDSDLAVDALVSAHDLIFPEGQAEPDLTAAEQRTMNRAVLAAFLAAGHAAAEAVRADWLRRKKAEKAEAARREIEQARRAGEAAWARLQAEPPQARRRLIADHPEYRTAALVACVCEASVRAAAGNAGKARELAELALFIAERVKEPLRSRAQGYCWAFIGNARRIAEDFDGADEAFARAWKLWEAGADCELLPESRLLELETSLRRAQHRLPLALKLLDRAQAASGENPVAVSRILLQKGYVLDLMGNIEGALAALEEAAPTVEASGEPRLRFALRFNIAEDLWRLGRYAEAAELMPSVRELAVEQRNELDLLRVVWLAARVGAGQGRSEEAAAGLEQVRRTFLDLGLPYDAALAALDLAVIWLRTGHTAKVRELALEMEAVFKAKKIRREALAALLLFCEAARRETATVALVRRTIADIEKMRRSPSPAE
jgi:transcriptional regulator with XRE-family HTH domain